MLNLIVKQRLVEAFAQVRDSIVENKTADGIEFNLNENAPKWITDIFMPQLLEADDQECFGHQVTFRVLECIKLCAIPLAKLNPQSSDWNDNLIDYISEAVPDMSAKSLTEWLDEAEGNLFWLTQALDSVNVGGKFEIKDGEELLRSAHREWFVAAGNEIVHEIMSVVETANSN